MIDASHATMQFLSAQVYNVPWTMMFTDDKVSYLEWCKAKTLELVKTGKVELPLPRPPP